MWAHATIATPHARMHAQLYMKKALKEVKAKKPNLSHKEAFTEVSRRRRPLACVLGRLWYV